MKPLNLKSLIKYYVEQVNMKEMKLNIQRIEDELHNIIINTIRSK